MIKDGIININKPEGMTSHDVIYKLRKIIGVKKMGQQQSGNIGTVLKRTARSGVLI